MTMRSTAAVAVLFGAALSACGSRGPTVPEPPEPVANASNAVILPPVGYGKTAQGLQLSKADDRCDVPASLHQAIEDQLEAPYEFAVPSTTPAVEGAPTLRLEITDLLANAGGMYGGPKIVQLHGTLERPGKPVAQFTAQREMFIYFGLPRSTCSMVGQVTYALGTDIAKWLSRPIDGARLGDRP